jgi:nucleotide-binding universal stress UspA family protein
MSIEAANIATDVQLNSVLIATDFSAASEKALRHALTIARYYGAKLYLMHVVSSVGLTIGGPEAIAQATTLALRDASLSERQLVASGALRDIHHRVIIRQGDVWTELESVIRNEGIDLLVIGTHGRTGFKKLVLGSVAEQIFRNACCRVLTVGPCSPPDARLAPEGTLRPLLFTTDFSEASLRALPHATSLANQRRTKLVLLHILSPVPHVEGNRWYTPSDVVEMQAAAEAAARKRLQDLIANVDLVVEPAFMVNLGEPAEGILRAAEALDAEAIVMGSRCRNHIGTSSHLPWSTAYDVVCRAVCPVLTVRTENPLE